jgi:hypothetical protein
MHDVALESFQLDEIQQLQMLENMYLQTQMWEHTVLVLQIAIGLFHMYFDA